MTTKNGLPCDFIITFIEDKEKRWWLYTRCGVVELSDSELQRWWANPEAIVQNRVYDTFDGAQPNVRFFQLGRVHFRWARVVFQRSCRADDGSIQALAESVTGGDLHRIGHLLTERRSPRPITSSSRRTRVTCRLITLRPRYRFLRR